MRKHGGKPPGPDTSVTLEAISSSGVARGRFLGVHHSGPAECKPAPLWMRGASSHTITGAAPEGTAGCLSKTECTLLPTYRKAYLHLDC